ncbi:MAG: putative RNA uridine N3 methyltransferase [Candidatus Bathyarchaeia archaeon]
MKTLKGRTAPKRRTRRVSVAIPASFVSDTPHLREKTFRIGLVGRAAAIFRVDEIIVYPDMPNVDQTKDANLLALILSYMETPQYLRKRLFKIRPELRYAGVLPPLRTPHHPLTNRLKRLTIGEHREGVVVSSSTKGSFVDVGVEQLAFILGKRLTPNTRVTVRIIQLQKQFLATLASREEIEAYWGYRATISNVPFGQLTKRQNFDLVIATSRKGKPVMQVMDTLKEKWKASKRILISFGAPTQGLYEIVAQEHRELEDIAHFVVNTIPNQGTETVRTEEALYATLAVLNTFSGKR